jgi:isopenicillin N synthase-like dioxygenase
MSLPVISLAPLAKPGAVPQIAAQIREACAEYGVFYIVDHGVAPSIVDGAFAAARHFFAQPQELRQGVKVNRHNRGYMPLFQTTYPGNKPDLKESFNMGVDLPQDDPDVAAGKPLHGTNQWPALEGFRGPVEAYFAALAALGRRMLAPLSVALGEDEAFLEHLYARPIAFLRLFHYPPESRVLDGEYGAAEHTDYGLLTILAQDSLGGLEVRTRDGEVVPAPPIPNSFVVNIGDLVSDLTNGALRSAPHRVINRAPTARYSIPFFFDPSFDAEFATLPRFQTAGEADRLAPTIFGKYLLAKFNRFYAYRKELA